MTDPGELRAVMASAEEAAAAGNHAAAEQFLREAARLQEASVGPVHPDLANTLNNLGVVCEMTGKAEDAEQFYRRAHAIASASLPSDHPFVQTSEKNLRDFCEARGLPLERQQPPAAAVSETPRSTAAGVHVPAAPAVIAAPKPSPAAPKPSPAPVSSTPTAASPVSPPASTASPELAPAARTERSSPADPWQPPRASPGRALAVVAVLVVLGLGAYLWLTPDAPEDRSPVATDTSAAPVPAPQAAPGPTAPDPVAPPTAPAPRPDPPDAATPANTGATAAAPTLSVPEAGSAAPRAPTAPEGAGDLSRAAPTVVDAQLCRRLSRTGAWSCEPAGSPVDPGPLFFYTRLSADRDTIVRHRWYRGDRLAQAVELRVRANPGSGYRTYSRNTVTAQTAGDWRVELTAEDGALLHEVRFVVR